MKKLFLISLFLVTSCAQLSKGQVQPVIEKNYKEQIFFTTCSGAVEDWGTCANKASETCKNGYVVLKRYENIVGGRRELTFQCKK